MEERIKQRFNQSILNSAMQRFAIVPDSIRLLDGFESFIYEFERESDPFILRISHSLRRSESLILAEVDWINYLADSGVPVSRAIPSRYQRLVEIIDDGHGDSFLASAFTKAPGKTPMEVGWTSTLYKKYGSLLGQMHRLSRNYEPLNPTWLRPQWNDTVAQEVEKYLPPADAPIVERFHSLMTHLNALPVSNQSYGLIHQDAHGGNLFIDHTGTITLFDFDDCGYSWYANDIAIVLFYAVMGAEEEGHFTSEFMRDFMYGYRSENQLADAWLRQIPYFLKLREIDLYAVIHRSFDVENIDDPWVARYMQGRRQRLIDGIPTIDFDFSAQEF